MTTFQTMQSILQAQFSLGPEALQPDTVLKDLDVDSLSMVEILFAVEEKLNVEIPSEPAEWQSQMKTFGDLVEYVDRLVVAQRPAVGRAEMSA